jgi:hypothetical protein
MLMILILPIKAHIKEEKPDTGEHRVSGYPIRINI